MAKDTGAMSQVSEEAPQCPEDERREPEYSNRVPADSWLVGGGKAGAEGKPSFDHVGKNPKGL